jgi:haloacetate dehalogenase
MAPIRLGDVTLEVDDHGRGAPVLLLHGFPATRRLWAGVVPPLVEAGFRVLVPDLAGYGASSAPPGVSLDMASQARWMLQLLDRLGIAGAAIVAHDVGSAAAQLMLVDAPERVRGIAVLDGVFADNWAMEAVASIQAWDPADAARLAPVLARRLGKTSEMRDMLAAYAGEDGGLRLIRAACDLDPRQTAGVLEQLRETRVPALVLWGERDPYLAVDTVARPLAELLHAPLVLLPGGHFLPLDCPTEVGVALRGFLEPLLAAS